MKKKNLLIFTITLLTLTGCDEADLSSTSPISNSSETTSYVDATTTTNSSSTSSIIGSSITEDTFKARLKTSLKSMNNANSVKIDSTGFNFVSSNSLVETKTYYTDSSFITVDKTKGTNGKENLSTTNTNLKIENVTSTTQFNGLNEEDINDLEMYTYFKGDVTASYDTTLNDTDNVAPSKTNYLNENFEVNDNEEEFEGETPNEGFDYEVAIDYDELISSLAAVSDFSISEKDVALKAYLDNGTAYFDLDDSHLISLINKALVLEDETMTFTDEMKYLKLSNALDGYTITNSTDEEIDEMVDELFTSDSNGTNSNVSAILKNLFTYSKDNENVYLNVTISSTVFKMMPTIIGMLVSNSVPDEYKDLYTELFTSLQKVVSATDLKKCSLSLAFNDNGLKYINTDLEFTTKANTTPVSLISDEDETQNTITTLNLSSCDFKLSSKINYTFSDSLQVSKPNTTDHTYLELNK